MRTMSLTSFGNPPWQSIRGIQFSMLNGPTLVTVLVTRDAVDAIEQVAPADGEHLAFFNKHRTTFERIASAKHQRGEITESGAVIVAPVDLKTG